MSTLVLIRHGRSTSNSAGTLAGRTPGVTLDDVGRTQAEALGERLRGVTPAAVVCSPLERCQQTIALAREVAGFDTDISTDDRVQETDYGSWSGRLLADLAKEPEWATVQTSPSTAVFPDGERMHDVRDRMVEAVLDWNARLPTDAVWLLVSHGDPITGLLSWALGMPYDRVQSLMVDPASTSVIHLPSAEALSASREGGSGDPSAIVRVATVNAVAGPVASFVRQPAAPGAQVGGGVGATGSDHAGASTVAP